MRTIVVILTLLLTAWAASADWTLYRSRDGSTNGGWIASGTYQDLKVCEAAAKEMVEAQKTYAGCAPTSFSAPQAPPQAQPTGEDQKGPAQKQWEASEAARAKKKADAAQRQKEAHDKLCSEIITECQTYQGRQTCTSKPRC
jgi:hypothetical protein